MYEKITISSDRVVVWYQFLALLKTLYYKHLCYCSVLYTHVHIHTGATPMSYESFLVLNKFCIMQNDRLLKNTLPQLGVNISLESFTFVIEESDEIIEQQINDIVVSAYFVDLC